MMNDLISRQAAIDEIEYELEMINSVLNSALDSMTFDFNARERLRQRKGEAREILNSIQALPSAQQWIPVSERLPDHDECIKNNRLFNVSDGNRSYSEWFDYDKQKFGEDTMAGFRVDYAVIAWMSLPEPPEVEE